MAAEDETRARLKAEIEEEIVKRRLVLEYLADNNIRSIQEVGRCVNSYYRDPDEMMDRIL